MTDQSTDAYAGVRAVLYAAATDDDGVLNSDECSISMSGVQRIIDVLSAAGKLVPDEMVARCNHRYESDIRYNIKCDRGPGNVDLCEVKDCPLTRQENRLP